MPCLETMIFHPPHLQGDKPSGNLKPNLEYSLVDAPLLGSYSHGSVYLLNLTEGSTTH